MDASLMNKANILVVDDRPEGILAVQAVLDSESYNIVSAASGNEALKHLLNLEFAVILLDVQMPIMNGFETASLIRTREKTKDVPIIFMSAINQDEQYVYQGYEVGAVDYLLKPFDPYILRSKVSIFVDLYRKSKLIKIQAEKLWETEARAHAQEIDRLEFSSLKRYQNLADSIPQIVFRLESDGSFNFFNKVWFEYTGTTVNHSLGLGWMRVIHSDDLICITDILSKDINESQSGECECRIINHEGEIRWHLIRIHNEFDSQGMTGYLIGSATDIEDQKQIEEMQRFLSKAGEALVSSLDNSIYLKKVAALSVPYLADWVSFDVLNDHNEFENVVLSIKEEDKLNATQAWYRNLKHSPDNKEAQIFAAHELNDSSIMVIPLVFNEKVIGIATFASSSRDKWKVKSNRDLAQELTRRMTLTLENSRLYKLSQRAIEIRNDFLSIASHELNTPITSLKLQLQMVRKSLGSSKENQFPIDKFSKGIETSVKQVDRLINLIQILLDVTKIQSGKFTFNFFKFNVQEIVNEVCERHKEVILNSQCSVTVQNDLDLEVVWDKVRIEQVLTNLLTNAVKYSPGEIEISIKKENEMIALIVKDHGKGIPEAKLNMIFERFERATTNNNVSGLGLGLFIVKQIVDGHHGNIDVSSEEGEGTTFKVLLPVDAISANETTFHENRFH
jgi:PAS domain S-box-containing protein